MKKFGFAAAVAAGLFAAILGLASPAQAVSTVVPQDAPGLVSDQTTGVDHHDWLDIIGPHVNVPQVDTSVQQSR